MTKIFQLSGLSVLLEILCQVKVSSSLHFFDFSYYLCSFLMVWRK